MLIAILLSIGIVIDGSFDSRIGAGANVVDVPIFTDDFICNYLGLQCGAYYKIPWWIGPTRDTVVGSDTGTVVARKGWGFSVSAGYRNSWLYIGPLIGYAYLWDAYDRTYIADTSFPIYGGVVDFKLRSLYIEAGYNTGRGPFLGLGAHVYFPGDYE